MEKSEDSSKGASLLHALLPTAASLPVKKSGENWEQMRVDLAMGDELKVGSPASAQPPRRLTKQPRPTLCGQVF